MDIQVLDYGHVTLLDSMGHDLTTVNAARVSFDKTAHELGEREERLLNYLAQHEHTSPFRHAMLMVRITAPIFVARQMWKHCIGISTDFGSDGTFAGFSGGHRDTGWNEQSLRYSEIEDTFYTPKVWRKQSTSAKQGSDGALASGVEADNRYKRGVQTALDTYHDLLSQGVTRELARMVLPQSIYTSWIWTASLQAMLHVVDLRTKPDAQWETQQYGLAIRDILAERFPVCLQAWEGRKGSLGHRSQDAVAFRTITR